ncbi:hypothetical protein CHS0354_020457 [Potamilus streckersoni]|uniref:Mitochondria-eating protein C-terminal domain-containing protein n=1 Tax=Potamilus streckersoni TaxID=2493646 RepID=A0AAE0TAX8_9BIVA|nr:hypothetical protein CHS0354_020457 [Potamilus streckersoni]
MDVFGELEKDRFVVRDIAYHLLRVVRRAYVHCQYWNRIEKKLRNEKNISGLDYEHILGRGMHEKETEVLMKRRQDMVVQDFMENMISPIVPQEIRKTAEVKFLHFAEQCAEIIWWMCVQNPAMHLEYLHDRISGQSKVHIFNSDHYRPYLKSGEFVDFCVWPLIRLHQDGPILSKGVAQGMNK